MGNCCRRPNIRFLNIFSLLIVLLFLTACSSDEREEEPNDGAKVRLSSAVSGGGVKGPLANAKVSFYTIDTSYEDFHSDIAVATGTTSDQAAFSNLTIADSTAAAPFIMVFSAVAGQTTDLNSGAFPIITKLKTVVTADMLSGGGNLYATLLTTMAVDIAIKNANSGKVPYTGSAFGSTKISDKFIAALPIAASQVTSTVGYGLNDDIDIFNTPPLVDEATDTESKLEKTAKYRAAIEALAAAVNEMSAQATGVSADDMLGALTDDLSDGVIDGKSSGATNIAIISASILQVLDKNPEELIIPGTTQKVSDIEERLKSELASTGKTLPTGVTSIANIVAQPAVLNSDLDGDGVLNSRDAFPRHAGADKDSDDDGFPDDAFDLDTTGKRTTTKNTAWSDPDDDNDGVLDTEESSGCSLTVDCDGDRVNDNFDSYPTDATRYTDDVVSSNKSGVFHFTTVLSDKGNCGFRDINIGDVVDKTYGSLFVDGSTVKAADNNGPITEIISVAMNGDISWTEVGTGHVGTSHIGASNIEADQTQTDTLAITLSLDSATGTYKGTVAYSNMIKDAQGAEVATCNGAALEITSTRIYEFTGSEDFSSAYAIEARLEDKQTGEVLKGSLVGDTVIINGSEIYFSGLIEDAIVTNTFDPETGAFVYKVQSFESSDVHSDGVADYVIEEVNVVGLFVRAPDAKIAAVFTGGITAVKKVYNDQTSATGTAVVTESFDGNVIEVIGSPRNTTVFNWTNRNAISNDDVADQNIIGLFYPYKKYTTINSKHYMQVFVGDTAEGVDLCESGTGTLSGDRDFSLEWSRANGNFDIEVFGNRPYSLISCVVGLPGAVVAGNAYTVVIKSDMETRNTTDDVTVGAYAYTAVQTNNASLPERLNRRLMKFNGASVSTTEAGDYLQVSGFINNTKPIEVTLPTMANTEEYMLLFKQHVDRVLDSDPEKRAYSASPIMRVPGSFVGSGSGSAVRFRTRHDANMATLSTSRYAMLTPGLNGMLNVEVSLADENGFSFQLHATTDHDGKLNCVSNSDDLLGSEYLRCASTGHSIDYATDRVTLSLLAGPGLNGMEVETTWTLVLSFRDAINATHTLTFSDNTVASGVAKVVATELTSLTRILKDYTQRTHFVLHNPVPGYTSAILKRDSNATMPLTTNNLYTLWDDSVTDFSYLDMINNLTVYPQDGFKAQESLTNFVASRGVGDVTGNGVETVVSGTKYKVIMTAADNSKRTFKVDYTRSNPASMLLDAPILINGVAAVSDAVATPTDVSNLTNFTVSWTNTSVPENTEWQIIVVQTSGNSDKRSRYLQADVDAELVFDGTDTWTWTNQGYDMIKDGEQHKIFVRSRATANDSTGNIIQGQSESVYVN